MNVELADGKRRGRAQHWPGRCRKCFTLVELLIVFAIIMILAALLLPAIEKARRYAVRTACLSDRRQNYLQISYYANDHDAFLPPHDYRNNYHGATELMYDGSKSSLQRLIEGGYVSDPETLWCPAIDHYTEGYSGLYGGRPREIYACGPSPADTSRWFYDQPGLLKSWNNSTPPWVQDGDGMSNDPDMWAHMKNGNPPRHGKTGISFYFQAYWDANRDGDLDASYRSGVDHFSPGELTLSMIAKHWDDSIPPVDTEALPFNFQPWGHATAPVLITCVNARSGHHDGNAGGPPDGWVGVTYFSHGFRGVNGVFYDGSARWVSEAERGGTGMGCFENGEFFEHVSHMQEWARDTMTLTAP